MTETKYYMSPLVGLERVWPMSGDTTSLASESLDLLTDDLSGRHKATAGTGFKGDIHSFPTGNFREYLSLLLKVFHDMQLLQVISARITTREGKRPQKATADAECIAQRFEGARHMVNRAISTTKFRMQSCILKSCNPSCKEHC